MRYLSVQCVAKVNFRPTLNNHLKMKFNLVFFQELLSKIFVSGMTYLYILLAAKIGGDVYNYMLLGPVVVIISLVSDRGRSDSILSNRYNLKTLDGVYLEFKTTSLFVLAAFALNLLADESGWFLIIGIVLQGILQGYLDIFLKGSVVFFKNQNFLYKYQISLSAVNIIVCCLLLEKLLSDRVAIFLIEASPFFMIFIFKNLRPSFIIENLRNSCSSLNSAPRHLMTIVKILPPSVYVVLHLIGNFYKADFALFYLRCIYFVFGFLQMNAATGRHLNKMNLYKITLLFIIPSLFLSLFVKFFNGSTEYFKNILFGEYFILIIYSFVYIAFYFIYANRIVGSRNE